MLLKIGDLVYRKQNQYLNIRHNNEIWLVTGTGITETGSGMWIHIQNIHTGDRLAYKEIMLMKIETEASC
tara:strand:- start:472 stop:681 length:210 start_codon:yes stop_codon:yes gene_type:complete